MPALLPLKDMSLKELKSIRYVFFDIDDTFTSEGKLRSEAYESLWALSQTGLICIPVTGRPAGWCDFIARMWPVYGVIGENGAFFNFMKEGALKRLFLESETTRLKNEKKLLALKKKLLKKDKNLSFASDQKFREFDLAIDYCEDVKTWPEKKVTEILSFCKKEGAQAKLSSIHINTWYGKYDKLSCVRFIAEKIFKVDFETLLTNSIYLGDSPNDEPFFKVFPLTVGVANVKKFTKHMTHLPKYITTQPAGLGFAEFTQALLPAVK